MDRRKVGEVLWYALQCAKQDRVAFINAYDGDTKEEAVVDALADLKAFKRLQIKLFGTTKSELDAALGRMRSVDIIGLIAKGVSLDEYIDQQAD